MFKGRISYSHLGALMTEQTYAAEGQGAQSPGEHVARQNECERVRITSRHMGVQDDVAQFVADALIGICDAANGIVAWIVEGLTTLNESLDKGLRLKLWR